VSLIPRCRIPTDGRRWLLAGAALALATACAHVEAPPGGAADTQAPRLEATRPDTFARMRSYLGPVVFSFDEGLSEKGVDTVVTVSPRTSAIAVDKRGHEVRVELRRGWEPNRIYQVTLHPGVQDLFGNATKTPVTVVFSTGPEIVHTLATGTVIERTTLRPATGAVVEAVHRPDSVTYVTRPDSSGGWRLEYLPEGDYLVRAYNDTNKDQKLQPYEARDTATIHVTARDTARARRLALLAPDSTAPKAGTATGEGDVVEVRFDDFLDPAQPLAASQVTLTGPAGAVRVAELRVGPFPSAPGDSASADSARADSGAAARRDTTPQEPVPSKSLFIRTAAALAPETQYTVAVTGVRNLVGLVGGGEAQFKTPKAAPPPATPRPAATPGDSARPAARPTAPAPRAPALPPPAPPSPPPAPRPVTSPRPVAAPGRGTMYRPNRPHLFSY
jgi:hypothetical protein